MTGKIPESIHQAKAAAITLLVPGSGAKGKRWKAVLTYRVEGGITSRDVYFEEIAELHDIIERGPHWDTLVSCLITLDRVSVSADLTIEGSMEL